MHPSCKKIYDRKMLKTLPRVGVFEGQGGSGSGGGCMGSNKKIIKSTGSNIFLKQSRLEFTKHLTNFLRSFFLPECLIIRGSG
jgi:hypothetical protein